MIPIPMRTGLRMLAALAISAACGAACAQGAERDELERLRDALDEVVRSLAERGALPRQEAERLLRLTAPGPAARPAGSGQATRPAARAPTFPPGATVGVRSETDRAAAPREPVRVPYVPESTKREIREQIKTEVLAQARDERWGEPGALPDWLDWLRFEGDLRIRHQGDRYDSGNAPAAILYDDSFIGGAIGTNYADVINTTEDRSRLRIRARLGVTARFGTEWTGGMRLSTGSLVGPVSTSSTAGDPNDRYGLKLDRAFVRWAPSDWGSISAGRAPNPFYTTEALFATDLGFDGIHGTVAPRLGEAWRLVGTAGWFMLRENSLSADRSMNAVQLAAEWRPSPRLGARLAVGRYRYSNEEGRSDTTNFGTPSYALTEYERGFRQKGNTLFRINNAPLDIGPPRWGLASQFDVEQVHLAIELGHFAPVNVSVVSDLFRNRGFDRDDIVARTGFDVSRGTRGWLHRVTLGSAALRARHDWQLSFGWRRIEKDATLDAFTDPDFVLGGTNVRGYSVGLLYGIERNVGLGARWFSGREVEGPPYAVDVLQFDVNMRF